ncbi:MAG: hypothetical protein WAV11_02525 [Minisyncoccia bacterium]
MIELSTALFLMLSSMSVYTLPKEVIAETVSTSSANMPSQIKVENVVEINNPISFEQYVREYYADQPILAEIAKCESTFRHFMSNGEVLRGIVNNGDVGVMQINERYHKDTATKLGFDLETIDGNLAYAKWLYDKEGTYPWISSSPCWNDKVTSSIAWK